ncbi:HalOD1 output domain-containing protein [Halobaculum limi]|uniref:HalOD1 output domain-containing protein n=1 Tax=Halobaculum limi TaxID=3031916 RepID=UPI0032E3E9F8
MSDCEDLVVHCNCTTVVDGICGSGNDLSATEAVVLALADAMGVDQIDVPPLYEYTDPDALDAMLDRENKDTLDTAVVCFQVET